MPQGSLLKEMELSQVELKCRVDELRQCIRVQVVATNRAGAILASSAVVAANLDECELLPILAAEVLNGFLYRGARECTTLPAAGFRDRRKSLRTTS